MRRTKAGRDRLVAAALAEQVLPWEQCGWTDMSMKDLRDINNNPILDGICCDELHKKCLAEGTCGRALVAMDKDIAYSRCHRVRMVELRLVEEIDP